MISGGWYYQNCDLQDLLKSKVGFCCNNIELQLRRCVYLVKQELTITKGDPVCIPDNEQMKDTVKLMLVNGKSENNAMYLYEVSTMVKALTELGLSGKC